MRLENSRQAKAYHQARKQAMAEAGRHWADTDMQIRLRFAWEHSRNAKQAREWMVDFLTGR